MGCGCLRMKGRESKIYWHECKSWVSLMEKAFFWKVHMTRSNLILATIILCNDYLVLESRIVLILHDSTPAAFRHKWRHGFKILASWAGSYVPQIVQATGGIIYHRMRRSSSFSARQAFGFVWLVGCLFFTSSRLRSSPTKILSSSSLFIAFVAFQTLSSLLWDLHSFLGSKSSWPLPKILNEMRETRSWSQTSPPQVFLCKF